MSGTSPAESKENLTTLAPDIVAAILDETLPPHVTVHELAISPPVVWQSSQVSTLAYFSERLVSAVFLRQNGVVTHCL